MPVQRIADDVWKGLQKRATPLEDDINTVLRRILGLPEPNRVKPGRNRLPTGEYQQPILEALVELGGKAHISQVLEKVEKKLQHRLSADDYSKNLSGEIRWQNRAQWARYRMIQEGLLQDNSPRGEWEISPKGRAEVE